MLEILAAGISTFDRPKRCRGGEQNLDPVILNDPPEHPGIGRADVFLLQTARSNSRQSAAHR